MSLIGSCFPTSVSDGKSVYVVTGRGTAACITLDGKIQWLVRETCKTYSGEDCRNARSPVLWGNLLIAAAFAIERVEEPTVTDEAVRRCRDTQDTQVMPYFLHVRGRRI